jgi:hypothetical protein
VRSAAKRWIQARKSFLLRNVERRERRRSDGKHSKKGTEANRAAEAARRALRRTAEREAMRNVADARRTRETDALPAGEHLRAVAAFAEAAVRRVRGGQTAESRGCGFTRRGLRSGMGIPDQAFNSTDFGAQSDAEARRSFVAASG